MSHIFYAFEKLFKHLRVKDSYKFTYRMVGKAFIFDMIRPLFVKDWDFNEDFYCGNCLEPVLKRYLYCCVECEKEHEYGA